MSFSIVLASPAPNFYSPGDVVCGTVSLDATSDATIESVAIIFSGYSTVTLGPDSGQVAPKPTTRQSSHLLFRQQQLLQGAHWCEKGTSAWPFHFILPKHGRLGMATTGPAEPLCQSPWRSSHDAEVTVLPPSMRCTGAFTCSIEYVLVARLIRPPHAHLFGSEDLTARRTLRVRPGRLFDFPYACMGKDKASAFQHEIPAKRCPSLAKSFFSSKTCSDSRTTDCRTAGEPILICVQVPSVLDVRSLASNRLTISATSEAAVHAREEICVSRYRIELAVHTRVRTETTKHAEVGLIVLAEGSMTMQVHQLRSNIPCRRDPIGCNPGEHAISGTEVAAIPLSVAHRQICDLPPEFASHNIFRAYTINYSFRLQHGSVKVSFENRDIPISIADGTLTKGQPLRVLSNTIELPPSYEHTLE